MVTNLNSVQQHFIGSADSSAPLSDVELVTLQSRMGELRENLQTQKSLEGAGVIMSELLNLRVTIRQAMGHRAPLFEKYRTPRTAQVSDATVSF